MKTKMLLLVITVLTLITMDAYAQAAISSKTKFVEIKGRKIAYRTIGKGDPIILANRFRGNLDAWDPLFLDNLAKKYTVVTFNYSGLASSTGKPGTKIVDFANDIKDLADALGFKKAIVGGWSFGGFAAQIAALEYPDLFTHVILIGTNPPGQNEHPIEEKFFEVSSRWNYTVEDETYLFFEPLSDSSRKAAQSSHNRIAQRKTDLDVKIPEALWQHYTLGGKDYITDNEGTRERLLKLKTPMLIITGDHDVCFPFENWVKLSRKLQRAQMILFYQAGHGPHHQLPELTSKYIIDFIENAN